MNPRFVFVAAVVGALLVGGATTGGTRASWSDHATASTSSITVGQLAFAATTPTGVTVDKVAGSTATTGLVVDDTSLGKTLKQQITASVTSVPSGVTATIGTTCPGAASVQVDTTPTSADVALCVRVVSSPMAVTGNVTIQLTGAQQPSGWTTPSTTRSFSVTVNQPTSPPIAPVLSCESRSNNDFTYSWAPVLGDTYVRYTATADADANYGSPTAVTSPSSINMSTNNTILFVRVKATNSVGTSGWSNTLQFKRGTGSASITCGPPTP